MEEENSEIISYLQELQITDEQIKLLKDNKLIDRHILQTIPDDSLKQFIPLAGDRFLLREFCKKGPKTKKNMLIKKLRRKLNIQKGDSDSDEEPVKRKHLIGNKNAIKNTRKVEIGWLNFDDTIKVPAFRQVKKKNGGSTRKFDLPKETRKNEIMERAKSIFFPDGTSKIGHITQFKCELRDFSEQLIKSDHTIEEWYEKTGVTSLRFYLATKRENNVAAKRSDLDTSEQSDSSLPDPFFHDSIPSFNQISPIPQTPPIQIFDSDHDMSGSDPEIGFRNDIQLKENDNNVTLRYDRSTPLKGAEESKNVQELSSSKIVSQEIKEISAVIIKFCQEKNITDPVEILRKIQVEMVTGRPLEVEDVSQYNEGDTNFIMVDRLNLLETARDEIESINNFRRTLEVQFYNEVAVDCGGPRKEFFRLLMLEVKEKYFDKGLRELLADHYIFVGKLFALSIVQNGTLPAFIEPALVEELFDSETSSSCITNIQIGMDALGLYTICKVLPSTVFLFQSKKPLLTLKSLTHLLQPKFSEEGSNANSFEKNVYAAFLKYLRNVANGHKLNKTKTGTTEEPILGFKIHPSIEFSEVETSFLPTANTCICSLRIPRPSQFTRLPVDGDLFQIYDYAFTSEFYGLK